MALIKPSAKLTYDVTMYNPQALRRLTDSQIKAEYLRLRSIAKKRLAGLAKHEEGRQSKAYKYNKDRYPTLTALNNNMSRIRLELVDLSKFILAKSSTITGLREIKKETLATLKNNGMDFITESNFNLWGLYMQYVRSTIAENVRYNAEGVIGVFDGYVSENKSKLTLENLIERYKKWSLDNA